MRNVLVSLVTLVALGVFAVLRPSFVPDELRAAVGMAPTPLGTTPQVSSIGSFVFTQHQYGDTGAPVAYDPCKVLRIKLNTAGVTDKVAARRVVLEAVDEVATATGLRLQYAGPTTERPRTRQDQAVRDHAPALISFATSAEVPALKGRVEGVAGSSSQTRNGISTYVTGQVILDADTFNELFARTPYRDAAKAIVLHEVAHLVGLGHVVDVRELMYAKNLGLTDFGRGDRRGLAQLGQGHCS